MDIKTIDEFEDDAYEEPLYLVSTDEEGNEIENEVVLYFTNEATGRNYLVLSDGTTDEDGTELLTVFWCVEELTDELLESGEVTLEPIDEEVDDIDFINQVIEEELGAE